MKITNSWVVYIVILVIIYCNLSCKNNYKDENNSKEYSIDAIDTIISKVGNPTLTNDTIIFGFRLGMPYSAMTEYRNKMIKEGRIVKADNRYYGFIPLRGYCESDKGKVHQLIAKLNIKFLDSALVSIHANLYGPRFQFQGLEWETEKGLDPFLQAAEQAKGELGDTSTPINKRNNDTKDECVEALTTLFNDEILYLFHYKYGMEQTVEKNLPYFTYDEKHLWIKDGKMIQLNLRNNLRELAIEFIKAPDSKDSMDFRHLVQIGTVTYSTPLYISRFNEAIKDFVKESSRQSDSTRRIREKERVNSTGL